MISYLLLHVDTPDRVYTRAHRGRNSYVNYHPFTIHCTAHAWSEPAESRGSIEDAGGMFKFTGDRSQIFSSRLTGMYLADIRICCDVLVAGWTTHSHPWPLKHWLERERGQAQNYTRMTSIELSKVRRRAHTWGSRLCIGSYKHRVV